jgi:3-dehydroquinate dehydratase / shikimate dehydrogenase
MASATSLVGVLAGPPSVDTLQEIPDTVSMLEVREDLTQRISVSWLRNRFSGKVLYTLPNHRQSSTSRHRALIGAAREYDMVGLNADCDLSPEVLGAIPAPKRVICWKGPSGDMAYLRSVLQRISSVPARMYSMIIEDSDIKDGAKPLLLLKEAGRNDLTAICEGKAGFWSRVLAPYFGAPLVFGRLDHNPMNESGEPSIQQLIEDYGFPALPPVRELYGIVGNRVFQSPSPRLHNAGYRSLHHPALFLPFHVESFEDFWCEIIEASALEPLELGIKGLTIVSPYKEAAFAAAVLRSPMACRAGASNVFVSRNGSWEAHTTDPESIARIAKNGHRPTEPLKAAVIGCGGAGRAIAAALQLAGAHVTLVNRGRERGELAVRLLGLPFVPLSDFQAKGFSLLVNATPVGRDDDCIPFEIDTLGTGTIVVDLAYGARPTPLVAGMVARGGAVVDGYDVLLNQVRKQFLMMIGREMPATIGRQTAAS